MDDAIATLDQCIDLCATRGMAAIRVEALEERARLYADQGLFKRAYEQYIEFHAEDAALRALQREANARTLQAVFETTEARREGERFRQLSLRDALTGLRNRRHVDTELPILLARSREDGSPLSIGLVDLDKFKAVNDRYLPCRRGQGAGARFGNSRRRNGRIRLGRAHGRRGVPARLPGPDHR